MIHVDILTECDIHRQMFDTHRPAEFDAPCVNVPGQPGAYMCAACLATWGPGDAGHPLVTRLEVAT